MRSDAWEGQKQVADYIRVRFLHDFVSNRRAKFASVSRNRSIVLDDYAIEFPELESRGSLALFVVNSTFCEQRPKNARPPTPEISQRPIRVPTYGTNRNLPQYCIELTLNDTVRTVWRLRLCERLFRRSVGNRVTYVLHHKVDKMRMVIQQVVMMNEIDLV